MNIKKRNSSLKSKIPIIIAGITIIAVIIGVLFVMNNDTMKISLKTETVEAGEQTDLTTLIEIPDKMLKNYTLSVNKGDFNQKKLGVYSIEYILTNKEDKSKIKKSFDIKVVDTKAPEIICDEIIHTEKNEQIKLKNHIIAVDLLEGKINSNNIEIDQPEIDYSKNGKYKVKILAADSSGNINEKEIIIAIGSGGTARTISQRIDGYWKGKSTNESDSYQILQFRYKNGTSYYGGLTWGGNLKFDYISYDETLATGIVSIETAEKTWTETFFIDIGDLSDKKVHVIFKRGQEIVLDDNLTYLGDSLDEAKRKLEE